MTFTPNIGPKTRAAYVIGGAVMVAASFLAPFLGRTEAIVVGALGALTIVSGAVGF